MDYEILYKGLQQTEKEIKDKLALGQKWLKTISKESEAGDLKAFAKDVQQLAGIAESLAAAVDSLKQQAAGFDAEAYFKEGDFERQLLDICRENAVDVQGETPIYEMFPYKVKLDAENQDLYVDRKKLACMRPAEVVRIIKAGQTKLNKAPFNAVGFAQELSEAYDISILKSGKKPGTDQYLQTLYKLLTPMSQYRKEYDQQSFAFDLARLYISGITETKSGRQFQFGPSRESSKAVRILDAAGNEQYLSTICFY